MKAKVYRASQVDGIIIINSNRCVLHLLSKIDSNGVGGRDFLYVPLITVIEQLSMLSRNRLVWNDDIVGWRSPNSYALLVKRKAPFYQRTTKELN